MKTDLQTTIPVRGHADALFVEAGWQEPALFDKMKGRLQPYPRVTVRPNAGLCPGCEEFAFADAATPGEAIDQIDQWIEQLTAAKQNLSQLNEM